MTSIASGASYALPSPGSWMQTQLQSAVSAGTVNAGDQSALSGALSDIGAAMQASGPPARSAGGTSMQSSVDTLIDGEVTSGKLTSDQATELKSVFAKASQAMHGAHHHHAAPPPSDPTDPTSTDDATTAGTTDAASPTNVVDNALKSLTDFLTQLRTTLAANSTYGASGTQASSLTSALVNTIA